MLSALTPTTARDVAASILQVLRRAGADTHARESAQRHGHETATQQGDSHSRAVRDLLETLANTPEKQNAGYAPFKTVEQLRPEEPEAVAKIVKLVLREIAKEASSE